MMGTEQITSVSSEPNTTIEKPVTKPKFPESMERIINKNAFPWNARDIEAREIPESPGEFIAGMSIGPTSILIRVNGEGKYMVSNSRKYYGEVKRDVEEFLSPNGRADENCPFVPIAGEMNLAEYVYAMSRSIIAYEDSQYNIDFRFNAIVSNSSLGEVGGIMAHKNEENEIMIPMSVETAKKNAWQLPKVIFNGFDSTGKRVSENTSIEIRGYDDSYVFEDVAKKIGMEIEEQDGQITNIKNLPPFHIIEFSSKISPVPLIQKSENIIIGNVDDIIAEANIEMAMSGIENTNSVTEKTEGSILSSKTLGSDNRIAYDVQNSKGEHFFAVDYDGFRFMAFRRVEFQNEFDNFTHSFTSGGPSAVAKFLIQEFQTKQQRDEFIGMSI